MNDKYHTMDSDVHQNATPRILLVEDDKNMQMIYQYFCQLLKYWVHIVSTAQEALNQVKENKYDLMILDLGLPDMSGEYVLFKVREREKNLKIPTLPILITTAHNDIKIINDCYKNEVSMIATKPVSFIKFGQMLKSIMLHTS